MSGARNIVWVAMTGLSGCFYMGPPWTVPQNEAPFVINPTDTVNELTLVSDPTHLLVVATDPDDDVVSFYWDVQPEFIYDQYVIAKDGIYSAHLFLRRSPDLDGLTLHCIVTDYLSPDAEEVEWQLVVPQ